MDRRPSRRRIGSQNRGYMGGRREFFPGGTVDRSPKGKPREPSSEQAHPRNPHFRTEPTPPGQWKRSTVSSSGTAYGVHTPHARAPRGVVGPAGTNGAGAKTVIPSCYGHGSYFRELLQPGRQPPIFRPPFLSSKRASALRESFRERPRSPASSPTRNRGPGRAGGRGLRRSECRRH